MAVTSTSTSPKPPGDGRKTPTSQLFWLAIADPAAKLPVSFEALAPPTAKTKRLVAPVVTTASCRSTEALLMVSVSRLTAPVAVTTPATSCTSTSSATSGSTSLATPSVTIQLEGVCQSPPVPLKDQSAPSTKPTATTAATSAAAHTSAHFFIIASPSLLSLGGCCTARHVCKLAGPSRCWSASSQRVKTQVRWNGFGTVLGTFRRSFHELR